MIEHYPRDIFVGPLLDEQGKLVAYPLEANDRIKYLASNHISIPTQMLVHDSMYAAAELADYWVNSKNEQSEAANRPIPYNSGWVESFREAYLATVNTETNIEDIATAVGHLSTGRNTEGNIGENVKNYWVRRAFFNDLEQSGIDEPLKEIFTLALVQETAKHELFRGLSIFWGQVNTGDFAVSAVSRRAISNTDTNYTSKIMEFWQKKISGIYLNEVGLVDVSRVLVHTKSVLQAMIDKELSAQDTEYSDSQRALLQDLVLDAINIVTSARGSSETASSIRVPFLKSFAGLEIERIQEASDTMFLQNPHLLTEKAVLNTTFTTEEAGKYLEDVEEEAASKKVVKLKKKADELEIEILLGDKETIHQFHSEVVGKIVRITTKNNAGDLTSERVRYIEAKQIEGEETTLEVRPMQVLDHENGTFSISSPRTKPVSTSSLLRYYLTDNLEILDGVLIDS